MRLDKFLKIAGIIKRRTLAKLVADNAKVSVNGKISKPSQEVKDGDVLHITFAKQVVKIQITDVHKGSYECIQ